MADTRRSAGSGPTTKVLGIGGVGVGIAQRIRDLALSNVEVVCVDTDQEALDGDGLLIGEEATGGYGTGRRPELGHKAARQDLAKIRDALEGADFVILVASLGGGTGTGSTPVVADASRQLGAFALAFVLQPFEFEGEGRAHQATKAVQAIRRFASAVIPVPAGQGQDQAAKGVRIKESQQARLEAVTEAIASVAKLPGSRGPLEIGLSEIRSVFADSGVAALGFGKGEGQRRVEQALEAAATASFLDSRHLRKAGSLLVSLIGPEDITEDEIQKGCRALSPLINGANPILGFALGENGGVTATIIAASRNGDSLSAQSGKGEEDGEPDALPRGLFADSTPTLYNSENLDIPTIIRKGGWRSRLA